MTDYLEPHPSGEGWIASGSEIGGQLVPGDDEAPGAPYDVLVDGRRLTWEQLGRALEPYEGFTFRLSLDDGASLAPVVHLRPGTGDAAAVDMVAAGYAWDLDDEEQFLEAWDDAESDAAYLVREALAKFVGNRAPAKALAAAAAALRAGIKERRWPHKHMVRAAGFKPGKLPRDDAELWLGAVGGLFSMRDEAGMAPEEEASLIALDEADWVGAIVGLVRAGVGALAEPESLIRYINRCPEVEGEVDPEDAFLVEGAFELVLPAWEAAGAVDGNRRLTPLGRWGLPRALTWAWDVDFDAPPPQD